MVRIGGDIGGIELEPGDAITVNGNDWVYQSDGTLEGPAIRTVDTHTETIGSQEYHFAGDYEGSDADSRLDSAISAANDSETIFLESSEYADDRTGSNSIDKRLTLIGASLSGAGGTIITSDWELADRCLITQYRLGGATITLSTAWSRVSQTQDSGSANYIIAASSCILTELSESNVTFESGTSGGIVDSCTGVSVTDNGSNTVGDIA